MSDVNTEKPTKKVVKKVKPASGTESPPKPRAKRGPNKTSLISREDLLVELQKERSELVETINGLKNDQSFSLSATMKKLLTEELARCEGKELVELDEDIKEVTELAAGSMVKKADYLPDIRN